jgi:hypothetical protein
MKYIKGTHQCLKAIVKHYDKLKKERDHHLKKAEVTTSEKERHHHRQQAAVRTWEIDRLEPAIILINRDYGQKV